MKKSVLEAMVKNKSDECKKIFIKDVLCYEIVESMQNDGVELDCIYPLAGSVMSQVVDVTHDLNELENMQVDIEFDGAFFELKATIRGVSYVGRAVAV